MLFLVNSGAFSHYKDVLLRNMAVTIFAIFIYVERKVTMLSVSFDKQPSSSKLSWHFKAQIRVLIANVDGQASHAKPTHQLSTCLECRFGTSNLEKTRFIPLCFIRKSPKHTRLNYEVIV